MNRRRFLASLTALGLAACGGKPAPPLPPGRLLGPTPELGHGLRQGGFPEPAETLRLPLVIVGGGIGGLAAGWTLAKSGFDDFVLLEMENETGGNSRSGRNAISEFPLGAHYLPLPTREATAVRQLLAELQVLQGDPQADKPRYDEQHLCAAPQERLYRHGLWQEGLLPQTGVSQAEKDQYQRFLQRMAELRQARDAQGRRAFAIPMALSSTEPRWLALDRLSMRDWLLNEGFSSPHLHWYVDYACRDDYGTTAAQTSAWAGIHYFACRSGEALDAASDIMLTTPGGNAWLAKGMAARCQAQIKTGMLVWRVQDLGRKMAVDAWLPDQGRSLRFITDQVIWAGPLFTLPRVLVGFEAYQQAAKSFSHAPWLVANLSLSESPGTRGGFPLSWDNVLFDSPGLGYVVATHQRLRLARDETVITYYRALTSDPAAERQALLVNDREHWAATVMADLARPHPEIHEITTAIDIVRHGHAMARPTPGLITAAARQRFVQGHPRLQFAHADVSGFSLFEEAQYRGVLAAQRGLQRLGQV